MVRTHGWVELTPMVWTSSSHRSSTVYVNSLRAVYFFLIFLSSAGFFKTFSKISFRNTIRVSNSLDPGQAGQNIRPDLGPSCLQRSAAGDKF